jgi:hypothetical protein
MRSGAEQAEHKTFASLEDRFYTAGQQQTRKGKFEE